MHQQAITLLRCPKCGDGLTAQGQSLICPKRHCYDVARQGYVNLAPGRRDDFYTKALFESRAQVFASGVYDPVIREITQAIERHKPQGRLTLVDAGCGEGFYTHSVCPGREMTRIGFDLSKEAVRLAARHKDASFFVGDLAAIPLADGCADVVLDVFTPANYAQFARILKADGLIIKLSPRSGYLKQLRQAAASQLRRASYDGSQVEAYAKEHLEVLETREIAYTVPVGGELIMHLARMTPMLAGVDVSSLDLSGVREITVEETMVVGRALR